MQETIDTSTRSPPATCLQKPNSNHVSTKIQCSFSTNDEQSLCNCSLSHSAGPTKNTATGVTEIPEPGTCGGANWYTNWLHFLSTSWCSQDIRSNFTTHQLSSQTSNTRNNLQGLQDHIGNVGAVPALLRTSPTNTHPDGPACVFEVRAVRPICIYLCCVVDTDRVLHHIAPCSVAFTF